MADIKMNQLTAATKVSYLYGEDSGGNQVKITPNDYNLYKKVKASIGETIDCGFLGLGLLIVISNAAGASASFLLDSYNAYLIKESRTGTFFAGEVDSGEIAVFRRATNGSVYIKNNRASENDIIYRFLG